MIQKLGRPLEIQSLAKGKKIIILQLQRPSCSPRELLILGIVKHPALKRNMFYWRQSLYEIKEYGLLLEL
jgi:hypothetical protein